jgi:hypothetical protein
MVECVLNLKGYVDGCVHCLITASSFLTFAWKGRGKPLTNLSGDNWCLNRALNQAPHKCKPRAVPANYLSWPLGIVLWVWSKNGEHEGQFADLFNKLCK